MTTLHHLTLGSGHVTRSDRRDIPADIIDQFLPLIDAQGGQLPDLAGWYADLMTPVDSDNRPTAGGAYFQIADEPGLSTRPVVMAVACWREDAAAEMWREVSQAYEAQRGPLDRLGLWRDPPAQPPPVPWLAAWITPFAVTMDASEMAAFGPIEQALAWALMT